ncbi:MAG TPA: molybdenum cofactor guanylyltransferase [Pyrinomonadaceae bacterium]|nr:molybdenum cofactor guanylyltransferase [Pyrinomonadaceae bacterium]
MLDIDSFILIGGKSTRLGVDKAFVEMGGETLVERAAATVRHALPGARVTAVAGSESQFAINAITSRIPFVFDLYPERGPLGGLHAGLAHAQSSWIFVLACDFPFVSAELIELLAGRMSDPVGAVVPMQGDGRLQPLCGLYRVEAALPLVAEILERPRVTPPLHEVVAGLDPHIVQYDEYASLENAENLFININTPGDLERIRSRGKL